MNIILNEFYFDKLKKWSVLNCFLYIYYVRYKLFYVNNFVRDKFKFN